MGFYLCLINGVQFKGRAFFVARREKSPLPLIAIVLSAVAMIGMAVGGILLKQAQDTTASQLEQLLPPQSTMAAQLEELSSQVDQLTVLAQATPEPTATPAPTPEPTPMPTESANAEATPK